MKRLSTILAGALALQLLLSVALFWPREIPGENNASAALVDLAAAEVDQLIISSADDSLLLKRGEGGWTLPEYHDLPAQDSRVARVLIDLPALRRGWPVAGSANAATRFDVAENDFQRRVTFYQGEETRAELYVGTSPGFRKVHVRPAGEDSIYAVEFNSFELPVAPAEWLDKSLLQLRDVTAIEGLDYSLALQDDGWQGGNGETPAPDQVETLVSGLASLRVDGAADLATASVLADLEAPPTLRVTTAGRSYGFRLYEMEDSYFIQREDIPVYFSLSAYDYDRLNAVNAQSLYAAPENAEAEEDGDSEGAEGD